MALFDQPNMQTMANPIASGPSSPAGSPRFVPWTGPLPSATTQGSSSSRFIPWTGPMPQGGGTGSAQPSAGGGSDVLGALRDALGGLKQGVSGLSGLNSLGTEGSGTGNLSGLAGFDLGPLLAGLGGGLGSLLGGLGIAHGIQTGNAGEGALGGYGLATGLAGLGGSGALGAGGAAAASAAAPALGALALPAAIFGMMQANDMSQNANKVQAALHDTSNIRRDFGVAWPQLQGAETAYQGLQNINTLPPDQQIPALQTILQQAKTALGAGAAVSQFLSTQGGRHGTMPGGPSVAPLDVSAFEAQSGPLVTKAQLARYAAEDALRARGVDPGSWYNSSPETDVRGLARMAGVPYNVGETSDVSSMDVFGNPVTIARPKGQLYQDQNINSGQGYAAFAPVAPGQTATNYNLSPEDITGLEAGPNRLQNLIALLSRLSPGYANSLVGQLAGGVPDLFKGLTPQGVTQNSAAVEPLLAARLAKTEADRAAQVNPWVMDYSGGGWGSA